MNKLFNIACGAGLLLLSACASQPGPDSNTLQADFDRMMQWFPGEYDNHEQVWAQKGAGIEEKDRHEHIHHIFLPVDAPAMGEQVFFVKQTMNDDPSQVYRQRLYVFSPNAEENAIQLTIYSFLDEAAWRDTDANPEKARSLSPADLRTLPGCEVYWQFRGDHYHGYMKEGACKFKSQRSGKTITITDTLKLTEDEIWIGDKAFDEDGNKVFGRDEQHINRKVRYFTGWMGIKKQYLDASAPEDAWIFRSKFRLHNAGDRVDLINSKGEDSGYAIELAQLTYQNTKDPILKLGLVERATDKTLAYIWAETNATQLGMNLRWFQAGLKQEVPAP